MAKKKKTTKKSAGLSTINRAVAAAMHFSPTNVSSFKKDTQQIRVHIDSYCEEGIYTDYMNLRDCPDRAKDFRNIYTSDGADHTAAARIRSLMIGFWMREKTCFTFTDETMSFIDGEFGIGRMKTSALSLAAYACKDPIYIEFPTNYPFIGAFCGASYLPKDVLNEDGRLFFQLILIYRDGETKIAYLILQETSTQDFLLNEVPTLDLMYLYEALFYLGYVLAKNDAEDNVLTPYERPGCSAYKVNPIPFSDWMPEYLENGDWMKTGLASHFGFLSREGMASFLSNELCRLSEYNGIPLANHDTEEKTYEHSLYYRYKTIQDWENTPVVYRIDSRVANHILKKHGDYVRTEGLPADLLQYMPAPVVAFSFGDEYNDVILISEVDLGEINEKGIIVLSFIQGDETIHIFESGEGTAAIINECEGSILTCMCAFLHLLTIFKENASSVKGTSSTAQKKICQDGSQIKPNQTPETSKSEALVQIGSPVQKSLQLYDLTKRSVRRAPKTETEKYSSHKKSPHIRRRHPHRYWVGKGADRHLEVRWVDSMKINCSETSTIPTLVRDVND